jgi:hypothetical protein
MVWKSADWTKQLELESFARGRIKMGSKLQSELKLCFGDLDPSQSARIF